MNSKNKRQIFILSISVVVLFALTLVAVGYLQSTEDYENMSPAEQEEYDFQTFKKSMSEIYHQDVDKSDYERIRAGTAEMELAYQSDMEKYGKISDETMVAYCDHIFVGRVVAHKGNYQAQKNEVQNPYNLFDVEIIELIKGPALENKIELKQIGGYYTEEYLVREIFREREVKLDSFEKYDDGYYGFMEPNDELIEVGEVYLFVTVSQLDGRCTIGVPDNRVHLENYDDKGSDAFDEVILYKKVVASGVKDFDRIRLSANEEIKK
ncbi:hypothetical protein MsAg5_12780 [Methanosarcinaceae archaeon Ag5]|uniref:Uncharacterized protein n=1 Tax=Methanolapillus africanus TaxID=3028297 RepID=A0AAE4MIX5_9EURY|nr:hypothetical protein [Methanosarcinaceae archaeon Ag5]